MRGDIQALRGFAVMLVVLYHAKVPALKAGYLGVDVFFVISGYLITRLVKDRIETGNFSFRDFYTRRLRRLLPAAYCTFFFTAIASIWLLNQEELKDFAGQLLGALSFSANYVLWYQSGYFSVASAMKPLLHVWSLAIEEQYYLLLPASLVFTPRRFWVACGWFLLIASLGLCAYVVRIDPIAAFYLMPARAWEMALGSVGALMLDRISWESFRFGDAAYWASVFALPLVALRPVSGQHPGIDALIVCVATLVIILAKKEALARELPARILGWFGDISYSLYLVHWPIFAFLNNVWFGPEPRGLRYLLVIASIGLAYLQYRYVENPIRNSTIQLNMRTVGWVAAATLFIAAIPAVGMLGRSNEPDFTHIRRSNPGFALECNYSGNFVPEDRCQTSRSPTMLVWGDSFAMQYVWGIVKTRAGQEVIQAARSACAPLLGLATFDRTPVTAYDRRAAERCTDFNESVLQYLKKPGSPSLVAMSGNLSAYLWNEKLLLEDRAHQREVGQEITFRHLSRTVKAVRGLGKRIVLLAPVPTQGTDPGSCNERRLANRFIAGPLANCEISRSVSNVWNASRIELLARARAELSLEVIEFEDLLCGANSCRTTMDGKILYRDGAHLSYDGSEIVARRSGLVEQILAKAR